MYYTRGAPNQWRRCRKCRGVGERSDASDLQTAISEELGKAHFFDGIMAGLAQSILKIYKVKGVFSKTICAKK